MAIQQLPTPKGGIPSGNTAGRPSSPVIGDTYYNGQVEVLEIYNGTNWVANSAPPAVPTIVSVTDVGGNLAYSTGGTFTVVVTPGTGGATPLQYNVLTNTGGFSASSSGTTITLAGLTSATSFQISANAQNNFGTTVNSSPFSAVTATTVPQAPTIGTATASTSANEMSVSWTLGSNGGKALSAITITPYLNGTTAQTSRTAATTSSTSYTFTTGQLTAGATYTFKVKTTNANGDSLESNSSNSAIVPNFIPFDFLVVGGGGGGGLDLSAASRASGGAGAGGVRSTVDATGGGGSLESTINLASGSFTVTVGAGGSQGTSGSASVFSNITSQGGGGGGYLSGGNGVGGNGGSGGGQSSYTGSPGNGTSGQGYAGGTGTNAGPTGGGGGGGAGALGGNASAGTGGNGGNGITTSISGSSVAYGGGGGGGAGQFTNQSQPVGSGGNGGGGSGATGSSSGGNGTPNRGGGAGGQGGGNSYGGAAGGSGVVILRYPSNATLSIGGGLTASTTPSGNNKITTFNVGTGSVSF